MVEQRRLVVSRPTEVAADSVFSFEPRGFVGAHHVFLPLWAWLRADRVQNGASCVGV